MRYYEPIRSGGEHMQKTPNVLRVPVEQQDKIHSLSYFIEGRGELRDPRVARFWGEHYNIFWSPSVIWDVEYLCVYRIAERAYYVGSPPSYIDHEEPGAALRARKVGEDPTLRKFDRRPLHHRFDE